MSWNNIYDLYNDVLVADKALVDTIMAEIKAEIENRTDNNLEFTFTYELNDAFVAGELPPQKARVADQIIFMLRAIGIGVTVSGNTTLTITWRIRADREFMKSYY